MTRPAPLPDELRGRAFDRDTARRAGVGGGRLRRRDVARPWHGVYATGPAETVLERCIDYRARLKPGQFFTHVTAARLHGLPLPTDLADNQAVHVGAVRPADAPHAGGVIGHRLTVQPRLIDIGGLPVVDAPEAFCGLGAVLGLEDLVVVADHLLNPTALDEDDARSALVDRVAAVRRIGGAGLVSAIRASRRGARSPAETRVRLVLESAGLPRAELNKELFDSAGRSLGSPDLVWATQRVVLEYEGDGHRIDEEQFRYDIRRYDALAEAGWRVLRATGDDLTRNGRRELVRRVRAALARATSSRRDGDRHRRSGWARSRPFR